MHKNNYDYVSKCRQKNYDLIQIPVPKGKREIIKQHAQFRGMSMNEYIRQAIREKMERDTAER